MAKALIFLKAKDDIARLETNLQKFFSAQFSDLANVTVRLIRPPAFDPMYNTESPHVHPDLTIELLTAPGLAFVELEQILAQSLQGCAIDRSQSLTLLMHERVYLPNDLQPTNFHYLMVRRDELSQADYYDYYTHYHGRFGIHCPGIERYCQNYIDQPGSTRLCQALGMEYREVTSISEMNTTSLEAFFASPALMELAEPTTIDEMRFVNREQSVMFTSEVFFTLGNIETIPQANYPQHYDSPILN